MTAYCKIVTCIIASATDEQFYPPKYAMDISSTSVPILSSVPIPCCLCPQHNTCCPVLYMTPRVRDSLPPEVAGRGVNVGICVLVESSDHSVLLTCRAAHMRTFAGAWVPPGGHIGQSGVWGMQRAKAEVAGDDFGGGVVTFFYETAMQLHI